MFTASGYSIDLISLPGHESENSYSGSDDISLDFFNNHKEIINKNRILIGHSTGAKFILDWVDRSIINTEIELIIIDPAIYSGKFQYFKAIIRNIVDDLRFILDYKKVPFAIPINIMKSSYKLVPVMTFLKEKNVLGAFSKLNNFNYKILWGTKDLTTPYKWSKEIKKIYPDLQIIDILNRSHGWIIEEPELLLKYLE
ncbi:MAG: hypothetical protein Q9M91_06955 [Candidatus Dojkabacteria bacterium]|nr:hypothetical protein [Candidatus Dojkabacteria bacterium]MDQ7021532.1 hypothetical protein [Candidatus Dojkabacteria bacterium]